MAKILLVDDAAELREMVAEHLAKDGYIVRTATDAAQAKTAIEAEKPELILLDVIMPEVSGIELAGQLKNNPETADIPIILLTAKNKETDVIVGLSIGADDYMTKPFSLAVLTARIEAVLRRARKDKTPASDNLSFGSVRIFPASRQVYIAGEPVETTAAEFEILTALVEAGGDVLSREKLLEHLTQDEPAAAGKRTIDVHIAALRKKLGPERQIIKTVHGMGYRVSD